MGTFDDLNGIQIDKPDSAYEYFWYGFKNSVRNAASANPDCSALDYIARDVSDISDRLNSYQKEEKYDDIARNIDNFLARYSMAIIGCHIGKNMPNHLRIALANIKRWTRCSALHNHIPNGLQYVTMLYELLDGRYGDRVCGRLRDVDVGDTLATIHALTELAVREHYNSVVTRLCDYNRAIVHAHILEVYGVRLPQDMHEGHKIFKILPKNV